MWSMLAARKPQWPIKTWDVMRTRALTKLLFIYHWSGSPRVELQAHLYNRKSNHTIPSFQASLIPSALQQTPSFRHKMSPETICITGATGLLGSAVTAALLDRGHNLRLVVRSSEKGETALERLTIQQRAHAEYSVVPDLQAPGALDNAFKEVHHVFHIASPMPGNSDDVETGYVGPAVGMTLAVLSTAKLHDSIQSVVVTSSMMALIDPLA